MSSIKQKIQLEDKVSPTFKEISKQAENVAKKFKTVEETIYEWTNATGNYNRDALKMVYTNEELVQQGFMVAKTIQKQVEVEDDLNTANNNVQQSTNNMMISFTELNQALEVARKAWNMVKQATQEAYKWMEQYNKQFDAEFTLANKAHAALGSNSKEIQSMYSFASQLQSTGIIGDETILAGMKTLSTSASSAEQLKRLASAATDLAVAEYGIQGASQGYASITGYMQQALEGNASMLVRNKILTRQEANAIDDLADKTAKENMLLQAFNKYSGQSAIALETAQGQLINTRNAMGDLYEMLGEKVTPYIAAFEEAIYQLLKPALEWVADNMDWIAPTFLVLATVIGIVIAAITALSIANFIAGASWLASLWPILLIIAAIGILIYLVASVINYIRSLREESSSTFSAILGYLAMSVSSFYNIVIVPIQHAIAMLVNFFTNVWDHPLETVAIHFLNWANTILGIINNIAQAIDVIFGTNLSDTVSGWMSNLNNTKNEIIASSGYEEVMGLWENLDLREMYDKGIKLGENIETGIDNAFKNNDFLSKFNDALIPGSNGSMALNTTTGDSLLGDEDIELLLNLATRDFKIEYQQLTPQIMIDIGDVYENADIDVIKETLVEDMAEVFDYDLGGVPAW